jgi:hypothetical protein
MIERSWDTPDSLLQKSAALLPNELELNSAERKDFTKDDFKNMIYNTYNEYYGKFRDQFNPYEYLKVVDDENLVKRFEAFLEQSDDNILTSKWVPWFDLGNIPETHSFMRSEAAQIFYVPHNDNPDTVFIRYSRVMPKYQPMRTYELMGRCFCCKLSSMDPCKRYADSNLPKQEVTYKEF